MHKLLFHNRLAAVAAVAVLLPLAVGAQVRDVVSKEVSVGRSESALHLEFVDGALDISFEDGGVFVDGDMVGRFERGDALESAWRALLGQAIALDDGELAMALSDWSVPAELAGELGDIAHELDKVLEDALSSADLRIDTGDRSVSLSFGDEGSLLRLLVDSRKQIGLLEEAMDGLDGDFQIHLEEDVDVPAGTTIDGTIVAIGGDVRIGGVVRGDVVVVGGTLELLEGSLVEGEVRLADARVTRNLGDVARGLFDVREDERAFERGVREEVREELKDELRSELRSELRNVARSGFRDDEDGFSLMAPFRPILSGVGGLIENLLGVLLLGLLGAAAVAFAGPNVDAIAETARQSPGRSAVVGLAGSLLLIPVWILGAVALAVSVIGIPVAVAWLPLFPLAAVAAGMIGYLAVARNTGEWLADSHYPWTGWIRKSNPIVTTFGGLLGLMLAFMAANVISMAPFLGFLTGLLALAGTVITFLAIQIGFGAVLLTRAGRRRERWGDRMDSDAAWEAAMDIDVDVDPAPKTESTDTAEGQNDA